MCNDYGNHIPYGDYLQAFSQTRIPVKWPNAAPNLQPRDDIWPTDTAPVIRQLEDGTNEFTQLRWGFPPGRPKAAPVINFRSEGRKFPKGRCLVPASHFFEFTGTKSRSRNGNSRRRARIGSASPDSGGRCRAGQRRRSRC
jgi:putative SOS response-associated peptidase YedK